MPRAAHYYFSRIGASRRQAAHTYTRCPPLPLSLFHTYTHAHLHIFTPSTQRSRFAAVTTTTRWNFVRETIRSVTLWSAESFPLSLRLSLGLPFFTSTGHCTIRDSLSLSLAYYKPLGLAGALSPAAIYCASPTTSRRRRRASLFSSPREKEKNNNTRLRVYANGASSARLLLLTDFSSGSICKY